MDSNSNIVNLFIPCQMDMFQPNTAFSVITILERIGIRGQYIEEQTCCGRRFFMEGELEYAQDLSSQIMQNYNGYNGKVKLPLVIPDCSCAGYMKKEYRNVLKNVVLPQELDQFVSNVWELCDYIVNVKHIECLENSFEGDVFYFKSCAARNLYPSNDAPETLLRNTKGLNLMLNEEINTCCGANGRFALSNPNDMECLTGEIVRKITETSHIDYITSTDIHCLQHIDAYKEAHNLDFEVIHIADILKGEQ